MKLVWFAIAMTIGGLAGCSRKHEPVTAGGRPAAAWVADLNSPDNRVRKKAVQELGHIGTADRAAVPALIGALKDNDATVREAAVLALLAIGPPAAQAGPALIEVRDTDPVSNVRQAASKAVERVQGR